MAELTIRKTSLIAAP